eukprot:1143072-Pelagomonas_calceolata.AAC.1
MGVSGWGVVQRELPRQGTAVTTAHALAGWWACVLGAARGEVIQEANGELPASKVANTARKQGGVLPVVRSYRKPVRSCLQAGWRYAQKGREEGEGLLACAGQPYLLTRVKGSPHSQTKAAAVAVLEWQITHAAGHPEGHCRVPVQMAMPELPGMTDSSVWAQGTEKLPEGAD